jgi:16S rRNA (cytidine1402-2'-O)-methyltransferase
MTGTLSVVGTPIGNLGDITFRALETFKQADLIACEDTRVTSKLLTRYGIEKKSLVAYHARNAKRATSGILSSLAEGKRVALVTDAGTPGVSDPGGELVEGARAIGARVEAIPGPSALTAALSIAGLPTHEFVFLGFLPHKKGRQTLFKEIAKEKRAVVFYESSHRIQKALASLREVLSADRRVAVCRELTKIYEEVLTGNAGEVTTELTGKRLKGEFVVVIAPC